MKLLLSLWMALSLLFVGGCGAVKVIEPSDRQLSRSLHVVVSHRSPKVDVVCNGIACAGLVATRGLTGGSSGPIAANLGADQAAATNLDKRFNPNGESTPDVIFESIQRILQGTATEIKSKSTRTFAAFPSPNELLPSASVANENATGILHIQVWTYGIARSASTPFRPAVTLKAYLLDPSGNKLAYSQIYSVGADPGGKIVYLGDTSPYFATFDDVVSRSSELRKGLDNALDVVVRRIVEDIRPMR
jgi:hypothetical protein